MKTIETTWGKIFEKTTLILFNNYPTIINELGVYQELEQWHQDADNEIYQWYIVPPEEIDWLNNFCPEIANDIHYSEELDLYILAVYHFGTPWASVKTELQIADNGDGIYEYYKEIYGIKQ